VLVCNWPHSVGQNHFFLKMFFNRDSAIQKCFQKILQSLQVRKFSSLPADRTPICPKHHPSRGRELSVRTFLCVEKIRTTPACIRPDVSTAHLDDSQGSTSFRISFQNIVIGKIIATIRTMWIPVRTRSSIRQVSHSNPDVRTKILMVRTCLHQIWKLRASDQPSGRPSSWSGRVKPRY
jgi:hypothetical protein